MILPIHLYSNPTLRKKAIDIKPDFAELNQLISDMFETMYNAEGIGLAAPQIGKSIRLIVIDTNALAEDNPELKDFKRVIINPEISYINNDKVICEEGCLSIPGIREKIERYANIKLDYLDQNFNEVSENISGFKAVVIQHEMDHLEGKLFTDKLSGLKKHFVNKSLYSIKKGKVSPFYKSKI